MPKIHHQKHKRKTSQTNQKKHPKNTTSPPQKKTHKITNPEKLHIFNRYFSVLWDLFSPFILYCSLYGTLFCRNQKPNIFLDWEEVGTYNLLQQINRNLKMIFRHGGDPLGMQYKMGEQRKPKNFSLPLWCLLVFPTVAGELQVTPGVHWKYSELLPWISPQYPGYLEKTIMPEKAHFILNKKKSEVKHLRLKISEYTPASYGWSASPNCWGTHIVPWTQKLLQGQSPAELELHIQHMLHKRLRVRTLLLFLHFVGFCIKIWGGK